jgi:hypothetical protein
MGIKMTPQVAIALAETMFWLELTPTQIVQFQVNERLLCVDFDAFQNAAETVMGTPIFTHMFGSDRFIEEVKSTSGPALSIEEIAQLVSPTTRDKITAIIATAK